MIAKKLLPLLHRPILVDRFLKVPISETDHFATSAVPLTDAGILDLVTIAFNTPWVIREQVTRLRKYLADPFAHTVIDNSSDDTASQQIRHYCREVEAGYIRLPTNPLSEPSDNHGLALTWAWRHLLQPRNARYVGFLDHDIFPVRKTSLIPFITPVGMFGHQQQRDKAWYLWPGFCFFDRRIIDRIPLNFMPARGVDTGGRLWKVLYRNVSSAALPALDVHYANIREGEDRQSDLIEYLGDWLHVINAANWKPGEGKAELVARLLERLSTEIAQ